MTDWQFHLDTVGGIAGDMFCAAMLHAMPDLEGPVLAAVAAVLPDEVPRPRLVPGTSGGMACLRLVYDAAVPDPSPKGNHAPPSPQAHNLWHSLADHAPHGRGWTFPDMLARIELANLSPACRAEARAILMALAKAEAEVHGVALEQVHFHEIADWDSLADVVAAGAILAEFPGALWSVSDLPLGGGFLRTAHGTMPIPAPASQALLKGFTWRDDGIAGERVTPTGAAILRRIVNPGTPHTTGRLMHSGVGAGTRDLPGTPNILRVLCFQPGRVVQDGGDRVAEIAFEVDDMTGEEIGVACDRLRAMPDVRDLLHYPAQGKKGRPLTCFRLLCDPDAAQAVIDACFLQTSTIGLRLQQTRRMTLERVHIEPTADGPRLKSVLRPGGQWSTKAESDDIAATPDLQSRRRAARRAEDDGGST